MKFSKYLYLCGWILLSVLFCYRFYNLCHEHSKPGFDYWDSYNSAQSLFIFGTSYHDPRREWVPNVGAEQLGMLTVRPNYLNVNPIQIHPVLGAFFFMPYCYFDFLWSYTLYQVIQGVFFFLSIILTLFAFNLMFNWYALFFTFCFLWMATGKHLHAPLESNLYWGQTNITVLFFISLAIFFQSKNKPGFFSGLIVAAASDKLIPLLNYISILDNTKLKVLFWDNRQKYFTLIFYGLLSLILISAIQFSISGRAFIHDVFLYPKILLSSQYSFAGNNPDFIAVQHNNFSIKAEIFSFIQFAINSHSRVIFVPILLVLGAFFASVNFFVLALCILIPNYFVIYSGYFLIIINFIYRSLQISDQKSRELILHCIVMILVYPFVLVRYWEHHLIFLEYAIFLGMILNIIIIEQKKGGRIQILLNFCFLFVSLYLIQTPEYLLYSKKMYQEYLLFLPAGNLKISFVVYLISIFYFENLVYLLNGKNNKLKQ